MASLISLAALGLVVAVVWLFMGNPIPARVADRETIRGLHRRDG